jgi:2-C-methyl-D-erythritol 4-phosphate cytidylyltransferase
LHSEKYAIIVAGGMGTRMAANLPKQFMLLKGKPVLYYTIKAFMEAYDDLQVILVLPSDYMDIGKQIIAYFDKDRISMTAGGDTRFQSVKNGLGISRRRIDHFCT